LTGALLLRGFGMATILIVEDQEQILTLAQSFLEEQGHKTLSAATADEALAILTGSEAVDALFVDIILNGDMQSEKLLGAGRAGANQRPIQNFDHPRRTRPGTRRTLRGPAIQIAVADITQHAMAKTKASL
jgi:CheY-like chemotaxis protein